MPQDSWRWDKTDQASGKLSLLLGLIWMMNKIFKEIAGDKDSFDFLDFKFAKENNP